MKVLLDTHTIVWAGQGGKELSALARSIVANTQNIRLVSAVTAWEIATKVRIGKFDEAISFEADFIPLIRVAGFELLPITTEDALRAGRFLGEHRDPWDRMLAAQALGLDIPIVSKDRRLDGFGVRRLW